MISGRLRRWRRDHSFLWLSISLLVILLLLPIFINSLVGYLLFELLYLNVLLMGISATGLLRPRSKWILAVIWGLGLALSLPDYSAISQQVQFWFNQAGSLAHLVILIVCITVLLRHILATRRVSVETLFAAASVYMFLALAWAQFYMVLTRLSPNAFKITGANLGARALEIVYFSLTTITTLGYGDVVPLSEFARMLSVCEALTGQLFLAMLVAWLVGMYLGQRKDRQANGAEDRRADS